MNGDTKTASPVSDWLALLERVIACSEKIALTAEITKAEAHSRSPKLLSACLLIRSTSNARAAMVLVRAGFLVEARIIIRSIFENKFYLYALATQGEGFVQKMVSEEIWSQSTRGQSLFSEPQAREGMPGETQGRLRDHLKRLHEERPSATSLSPKAIIEGTDISAAYIFYQQLSADAAHPSLTALNRHVVETEAGGIRSICLTPPLRIEEVRDTALLATMSLLGVCVAANQILGNTKGGQHLDALVAEYQSLTPSDRP